MFFFGSYQGTRQVNGLDPTSLSTLILPPLTDDRSQAAIGAEFCPANKPPAVQSRYLTFAGGTQVACDGSNINPVAINLLQMKLPNGTYLIPTPQDILTSGKNAGLGSYAISLPSHFSEDQYTINFDYLISPKNTLSGRGFVGVVHQLRSLTAPYAINPGPQAVPGAPHAFDPTDDVTSLKLTSTLSSNLVNEVRFAFSNDHTDQNGQDVPPANVVGMTPFDPIWNQPPEIDILGSLGTFRFLGNIADDGTIQNRTYQLADNVSWIHGKHTTRMGGFVDTQLNGRDDTGSAKGKITIQNFTDFLLGLSATQNGSPLGRSNIETIQGNAGDGPIGVLSFSYRTYYAAAFIEDDIKMNSRFTLNLGLRWEYIGPAYDTRGAIGNVWPSLLGQSPIPPALGTFAGNTIGPDYNPESVNPYTGQPFGPAPSGVFVRSTRSFYENATPRDTFAPRLGFAWQPGGKQSRLSVRGGYGWFYQTPPFSGNFGFTPFFASPPFAQSFCNSDASNGVSTLGKPLPTVRSASFRERQPRYSLTVWRARNIRFRMLQQWSLNTRYNLSRTLSLDLGYVGTNGDHLLLSQGLNQPLLASPGNPVNCGYDGIATDCITQNTSSNAYERVPILGETPTALADNNFIGRSWYQSLQATLSEQLSRGLTFQVAYTFSKAENNTVLYNDQNNLALDWARAAFDRTHRFIANYDYQLPSLTRATGFTGTMLKGWSLVGNYHHSERVAHDPYRSQRGRSVWWGRRFNSHAVSRGDGRKSCDIGEGSIPVEQLDQCRSYRDLSRTYRRVRWIDWIRRSRANRDQWTGTIQHGFFPRQNNDGWRYPGECATCIPRRILQRLQSPTVRQSGDDLRDGKLWGHYSEFGRSAADSIRPEVLILKIAGIFESMNPEVALQVEDLEQESAIPKNISSTDRFAHSRAGARTSSAAK